ncbi:hypothetical protein PV327_006462 [Microctonus hyperodae]|uniref:Uncharacterized protein n=1 Tax=Microctonus hyperodae TaxID=165561 RepID=A0AA39F4G6_MICHY|nr:hypothetical protein PV327_006462 [Microctonus hyperodae]
MDLNGRKLRKPNIRFSQFKILATGLFIMFGLAVYPTIISPILNPEPWKQFRKDHPPPTDKRY